MPTWVLNPKSLKAEPHNEEESKILLRGEAFESLISTVAWKEILDFLEQLDDEALAAIRGNKSSDPKVAAALQTKLQERGYVLNELQHFVVGAVEQRRAMLEEQTEEQKLMEEILHGRNRD